MTEGEKLIAEDRAKRKELSRVRIFWFLVVVIVLLIIYLAIQVTLLLGQ